MRAIAATASLDEVQRQAVQMLEALSSEVEARTATPECFERSLSLVAALPLDTIEFALAKNRLSNAGWYYTQNETELAKYELTMAIRRLRGSLERERQHFRRSPTEGIAWREPNVRRDAAAAKTSEPT